MAIDYKLFTALFSSSHAAEAMGAIAQQAESAGFGPAVSEALKQAVADAVSAERTLQEDELRQAFSRLEWLGRGRQREAYETFAAYVNAVSLQASQRDAIADGEAFLLSARDENGAFIVSNQRVLDHLHKVGGTIDRMATRYLADPNAWSRTLAHASKDVGMMVEVLHSTVPGEFENPYHRFRALTQRTLELALAARATEARGGEEAREIEDLSFAINGAFEEGRFHDVIQLALEVWVRSVELLSPLEAEEDVAESVRGGARAVSADAEAAKILRIREEAPAKLQPATVASPFNIGTALQGVKISTLQVFGAIQPCTRFVK